MPSAIESREVAKMVEKQHKDLLRDIVTYTEYMNESTERNFAPSDFFAPSTYKDSTGRTLPCYLITKKGCEMIANKLTGRKGIQFTAAYVQKFNEMEKGQRALLPTEGEHMILEKERLAIQRMRAENARLRLLKSLLPREEFEDIARQIAGLAPKPKYKAPSKFRIDIELPNNVDYLDIHALDIRLVRRAEDYEQFRYLEPTAFWVGDNNERVGRDDPRIKSLFE